MAKVEITFPKDGATITTQHKDGAGKAVNFWVASGTADHSIVGVFGSCTPGSGGAATPGKLIAFNWDPRQKTNRWMILFQVDAGSTGGCEFTVTGIAGDGTTDRCGPRTVSFPMTLTTSTIQWPGSEDITDYEDDFTPYGDLEAAVTSLTMTYPPPGYGSSVTLIYLYQDYTDQHVWAAQFDTLPSATEFNLTLVDADSTSVTVNPYTT